MATAQFLVDCMLFAAKPIISLAHEMRYLKMVDFGTLTRRWHGKT